MKKFSALAVAGLMVSGLAQAIVNPLWERPIMGANLSLTGTVQPPLGQRAIRLTINKRDGVRTPTSFTLTEDTGIRCITTPCPSTREVQFTITGVHASFSRGDSVRYEAVEVLKNIPANVRIARRHLNVTESSMELVAPGGNGFTRRTYWEIEVVPFAQPAQTYSGQPTGIVTIQ